MWITVIKAQRNDIIHNLDGNPGLFIHPLGQAKITYSDWTIIKPFDLTGIIQETESLRNLYFKLSSMHNDTKFSNHLCKELLTGIDEKLSHLLYAPNRVRRGLLNIVGSLVKGITGNLDAEDGIRFETAINSLSHGQKLNDKRLSIVTESVIRLNASVSHVVNNQLYITKKINQLQTNQMNLKSDFAIAESYSILINTLSHISYLLNNLLTALTFSKLNVLHPSIISTNELLNQLSKIDKNLPNHLIFKPEMSSIESFEQVIQLSAYHTNSRIVFLLHVPITSKIVYSLYHSYTLPMIYGTVTQIILPTAKYFMSSENAYMFTNDPCLKTKNGIYLCREINIKNYIKETCEYQLLQRIKPYQNCNMHTVNSTWKMQSLGNNAWLYFEPNDVVGNLKCQNSEQKIDLKGSYLIQLPKGCIFQTHEEYLITNSSEVINYLDTAITLPKIYLKDKTKPIQLHLEEVHLDDLMQLKSQLAQPLDLEDIPPLLTHTISSWTIITYVLIFVISLFLARKYVVPRCHHLHRMKTSPKPENEATLDDIALRP